MSKYKKKKKYEVEVTERIVRHVVIEAETKEEAEIYITERWDEGVYGLDTNDTYEANFEVVGEVPEKEDLRAETR